VAAGVGAAERNNEPLFGTNTLMAHPDPYRQYQTTQVSTAGPAQLTLMCYDGALRFLLQGREAMIARRYDVQDKNIGRAQALLSELLKGLDFERGGEVARNLDAVYRYLYDRLTHANRADDVAALDEVRAALSDLREAWSQMMTGANETGAAARPTANPFAPAPASSGGGNNGGSGGKLAVSA